MSYGCGRLLPCWLVYHWVIGNITGLLPYNVGHYAIWRGDWDYRGVKHEGANMTLVEIKTFLRDYEQMGLHMESGTGTAIAPALRSAISQIEKLIEALPWINALARELDPEICGDEEWICTVEFAENTRQKHLFQVKQVRQSAALLQEVAKR